MVASERLRVEGRERERMLFNEAGATRIEGVYCNLNYPKHLTTIIHILIEHWWEGRERERVVHVQG